MLSRFWYFAVALLAATALIFVNFDRSKWSPETKDAMELPESAENTEPSTWTRPIEDEPLDEDEAEEEEKSRDPVKENEEKEFVDSYEDKGEEKDGKVSADGEDVEQEDSHARFPPSSYFEERSEAFKELQQRAGDSLIALFRHLKEKKAPSKELVEEATSWNYLQVKCMCYVGLGNRLPGLVAGFGVALADTFLTETARVVLVEYPIGGCRGARRWWDHQGIDWDWPRRANCTAADDDGKWTEQEASGVVSDDEFEKLDAKWKRDDGPPPMPETLGQLVLLIAKGRLPNLLQSLFKDEFKSVAPPVEREQVTGCLPIPSEAKTWLFNDENHLPSHLLPLLKSNLSECNPSKLWKLYSGDYILPLLEANPHYAPFFNRAFPGGNAFYHLSRAFWRPITRLESAAKKFAKEHFGQRTVGVHVRTIKNSGTVPNLTIYVHAALSVARAMGALPRALVPGSTETDVDDQNEDGVPLFRLFLATDSPNVSLPLPLKDFTISYTPPSSLSKLNPQENPSSDDEGIVDMLLLGLADATVTTFGSSFGNVAASLVNKHPFVALHQGIGGLMTVIRATTSEPCLFHASVLLRWAGEEKPEIEYPDWFSGDETEKKREQEWANEAGKLWEGYYGHRAVGECHW